MFPLRPLKSLDLLFLCGEPYEVPEGLRMTHSERLS